MTQEKRALKVWIDITSFGLPLLVMLAPVLGWSRVLQLLLGILCAVAILGTKIALTDWDEWRAGRARRRRRRALRRWVRRERRSRAPGTGARRTRA